MAKKKLTFEDALQNLESLAEQIERGQIGLEESIKKYEEGMQLSQQLSQGLEQAQKRVDVLMKNAAGEMTTQPFNTDDETDSDAAA